MTLLPFPARPPERLNKSDQKLAARKRQLGEVRRGYT